MKFGYKLFLISLLIFGVGLCLFIDIMFIAVYGQTGDIDYAIQKDALVDTTLQSPDYAFNLRQVNQSGLYEKDKYEFTFDDDGTVFQTGGDAWFDWHEFEVTGDYVNTFNPTTGALHGDNGYIRIENDRAQYIGFKNDIIDPLNLSGTNINITWRYSYYGLSDVGAVVKLRVRSQDSTDIIQMTIECVSLSPDTVNLTYYNGFSHIFLDQFTAPDYSLNDYFELNLYLSSYTCYARWYITGVLEGSASFSLLANKLGFSEARIRAKDSVSLDGNEQDTLHDFIGIYQDNVSICREWGYVSYDMGDAWNHLTHNLLFIDTNDVVRVEASDNDWVGVNSLQRHLIKQFHDTASFINTRSSYFSQASDDYFHIYSNTSIDFTNLDINLYGINMSDGTNDYLPTYYDTNININTSYYYVDDSSRLRFIHLIDQDSTSEIIGVDFDINNVLSVNRSMRFDNYYNGIGGGNFRVNFTDATSFYDDFTPYFSTANEILEQDKIIDAFHITITDNNLNIYTNYTVSGYIDNISLVYWTDIDVTITIISLLAMLIPLILILFPTLAFYTVWGKRVVLPIFILMVTVCFATSLIPAWLFFVILIATSVVFFVGRKRGEGL